LAATASALFHRNEGGDFNLDLRAQNDSHFVHAACPSVSFNILSPPEGKRHISTSLPAGTDLAQVICGLLSYFVVENLQVTIQDASRANEFVNRMLAVSSPGKMMQLKGTDSASAGLDRKLTDRTNP
jgi:hypothetical protein